MPTALKEKSPTRQILTPEQIGRLSSRFLVEGRKQDNWEIKSVEVDGKDLEAQLRMSSFFVSPTDTGGFHLSVFAALEILSQMTIISIHHWAGFSEKTREVWMIENKLTCKHVIRNPEDMRVKMHLSSARKVKGSLLFTTDSELTDDRGGRFRVTIKGLLSLPG